MVRYRKINSYKKIRTDAERARKYRRVKSIISKTQSLIEQECENEIEDIQLNIEKKKTTRELLRSWANCHGITTRAINDLLKILILAGLQGLPRDYKSLLQTPRSIDISMLAGGKFWYNGIERNLRNIFSDLNKNVSISLNFNFDGLPIFNSSKQTFWPILSTIHEMPYIRPIVVAIWCGPTKPTNLSEYLREFVDELKELMQNGVTINSKKVTISYHCSICDTPARSFLKGWDGFLCVVNFNHRYGCQKCLTEGQFFPIANRMSFPKIGEEERTDNNFRNPAGGCDAQEKHHKEYSILQELDINMITGFPTSDPLHLFELGIMKKNLLRWKNGDLAFKEKWTKSDIEQINIKLDSFINHKPIEIHRKVRNLDVLKYWKGTEFRSFLLYYGMVALIDHLAEDVYYHYITLVCAVTIFYTESYVLYQTKAAEWLNRYIEGCVNIYGIHSITSNFHNLTHVFDDVKLFGSLQNISTYPFENRLNFLKRRLKQPNLPIEQIARRLVELSMDYDELYSFDASIAPEKDPMSCLKFPFETGPFQCSNHNGKLYKEITTSDYTLSSKRKADSWFLTYSNEIVQFQCAGWADTEIIIYGKVIVQKSNFFKYPCSSMFLNIFESSGITDNLALFKIENIKAKMFRLPNKANFVFIPLVHTLK